MGIMSQIDTPSVEPSDSFMELIGQSVKKVSLAAKNESMNTLFGNKGTDGTMLWGLLHIKIIKCEKLRDADASFFNRKDKSDPYVEAYIDGYRLVKTSIMKDNLNPVFNEEFFCPVAHYTENIMFKVMDKDDSFMLAKDDLLGDYTLPVSELIKYVDDLDMKEDADIVPGDFKRVGLHKIVKLSAHVSNKVKDHGTLEFMIEFIPTRMLSKTPETPGVYFHTTHGNDVKLYMNADDDGSAPVIRYGGQNDDEKVWKPPRMWRDVFDAICNAEQFIYAVGWSFDTDQYLLRGDELTKELAQGKYSPRLGELLLDKAEEGLVVNLMQWDDFSSNMVQQTGKMGTYDEQTRNFFKGTKVNARFMSMAGGETNTILEGMNKTMAFTHHQKFIIVDAPKANGKGRELLAFVGGIDLTEGRWDNRQVRHMIYHSHCVIAGQFLISSLSSRFSTHSSAPFRACIAGTNTKSASIRTLPTVLVNPGTISTAPFVAPRLSIW